MCVDGKVLRITLSAWDADTISHWWVPSGVHKNLLCILDIKLQPCHSHAAFVTVVKVRIEDHKTKLHSTFLFGICASVLRFRASYKRALKVFLKRHVTVYYTYDVWR